MNRFVPVLLFLSALLSFPYAVNAQDQEPKYTRGQVIEDFLDIAFTDRMWGQDHNFDHKPDTFSKFVDWYLEQDWKMEHNFDLVNKVDLLKPKARRRYEERMKYYPWLAEYMYRPNGWPDRNVIHKWKGKITIGMGWPRYDDYRHAGKKAEYTPVLAKYGSKVDLINEVLEGIVSELQKSTGLPVEVIQPEDPREYDTDQYARIRIVPADLIVSGRWARHKFPTAPNPRIYESYLWGGTVFETSNNMQMDAYMLPDADNKLGLVVCKITHDVHEQLFKALVGECLVRAMGFADLSKYSGSSFLGDWKSQYGFNDDSGSVYWKNHHNHTLSEGFQDPKEDSKEFVFKGLSGYDRLMIGLLYCPSIKSGMDMNDVFQALTSKDRCISKHFK